MDILDKSMEMLRKYALCDSCLGRQFALLGYGVENRERGSVIKVILMLKAHISIILKSNEGLQNLKILATNGFSKAAGEMLKKMTKRVFRGKFPKKCFLCEGKFEKIDELIKLALNQLRVYEYSSFLVGVELPLLVEEREDEFKAKFNVKYGENMRNEFGRAIGRKIAECSDKIVDHRTPEIVVLVNPFNEEIKLQINPLYIAGRYKKLVRGIPQSKWYCSNCYGKGCEECNWTGKLYEESVEEIIASPLLDAFQGIKASFHASGREDIDARMLGKGRPFIIEISQPKRRFLDLNKLKDTVNHYGKLKVEVSSFQIVNKNAVRRLKKAESAQKDYRVIIEFETTISNKDLLLLEDELTDCLIKQKTPIRVRHRRADLTREKYIYQVKVKKLSDNEAEMRLRCQGGLYVKELVNGDEGRTVPNISGILKNKAKTTKLDVLNIIV